MDTQGELLISFYRFFPEKKANYKNRSYWACMFLFLLDNWQVLTAIFFISSAELDSIYKSEC